MIERIRSMWRRIAQLDDEDEPTEGQQEKAEQHERQSAEERADRTLKFAHSELDKREHELYERNLILSTGGKRGKRE